MSATVRVGRLPPPQPEPVGDAPAVLRDAVHVWTAPLGTEHEPRAWLDAYERGRRARYRHPPDRMRFTTGRGLARRALAHYRGTTPDAIGFSIDEAGRPHPDSSPEIDCNLSHAGALVVCCIALGRCGIDVERVRALAERDALARRLVGPVHDVIDDDRLFAHWVLTEARAKADGRGLGRGIDRVRLTARGNHAWCGCRWRPRPGYQLAVVADATTVRSVRWFAHARPLS